ncbi:MAG TPA: peptidoglycan bridge formation glycyltransferase FemA/FemB family protein, partial [Candidatus Saccharimonadales bacterium]|nr:peptidoglycan bridge formation glycyltransferase FemA/FemB family protein [Candidatus Saccharimonadales bacterium]
KTKNIKVVKSNDIHMFTKFWRENFEKKRFPFFSQQKNIIALHIAFGNNSRILIAESGGKPIAALFILIFDKVAYYMYAASNNEGKKLFAPTLLTWEAILLTKKSGCKIFDFDGIYDERFPLKSWLGFTKFKKGFGGKEIEYPGCFKRTRGIIKL